MRKATIVVGLLTLGCGGIGEEFTRGFNEEFAKNFRTTFIDSCSQGSDDTQRRVCTCVADELIANKSPTELMELLENPEANLQPLIEKCAAKLVQ